MQGQQSTAGRTLHPSFVSPRPANGVLKIFSVVVLSMHMPKGSVRISSC